ncbi:MAG: RDD family protein [Planctomycetes bacterium]|nr:RDD family protein [Planctomycetota bacterium]MCB9935342.1 RDD family protein [Planctomycetota bacterium]
MQPVSYRAGFTDATRPEQGADRVGTLAWKHEVMLPEDVKAAFEVASPFARTLAFLIDLGIIMLAVLALFLVGMVVLIATAFSGGANLTALLIVLAFFLVNVGYFFLFEGVFSGQTPGKRVMKLRVVKEDGEEIGPREGIVRAFMRFLIIGPVPCLLFLGVFNAEFLFGLAPFHFLAVVMFVDRKTRGIPDFVANTLVVVQKVPHRNWNTPFVPAYFMLPHHEFPLNAEEMAKLTPEDYVKLEEFGSRLSTISSEARQQAAMAAAAALASRMNYSKPVEPEYAEVFLYEMHAALKQQLQQLYPDLYA